MYEFDNRRVYICVCGVGFTSSLYTIESQLNEETKSPKKSKKKKIKKIKKSVDFFLN